MPETINDYTAYLQTLSYEDLTAIYQSINRTKYPDRFEALCNRLDQVEKEQLELQNKEHSESQNQIHTEPNIQKRLPKYTIFTPITDTASAEKSLAVTYKTYLIFTLILTGIGCLSFLIQEIPTEHSVNTVGTTAATLILITGIRYLKSRFLSVLLAVDLVLSILYLSIEAYLSSEVPFPLFQTAALYLAYRFIKATRMLYNGPSLPLKKKLAASSIFLLLFTLSLVIASIPLYFVPARFIFPREIAAIVIYSILYPLICILIAAIILPRFYSTKPSSVVNQHM